MNNSRKIISGLLLALAGLLSASGAGTNGSPARELKPGPDDARIAVVTARLLEQGHYLRHSFDDEYSSKMLDRYIQTLDPQHMHFLQTDLDKFEPYRKRLDDLTLRRGDTWPAYEIFKVFLERLDQRTEYADELLKGDKFTFDRDERVQLSRKEKPAPADLDAAKVLWRERLRFEYLQEKLARAADKAKKEAKKEKAAADAKPKAAPKEITEVLAKRYHRNLHIFQEMDHDDVFELYLNSMALVYDPHTDYMGKSQLEQFAISMNLALFGIGAQLRLDEDGYCTIERLMPGGPAIKSKEIKEKERIVAVGQSNTPPVDIIGMNLNKAVQLIRGPKGTEVHLTLESSDATDRHEVTLIRDEIPLEDQQARARVIDLPGAAGGSNRVGIIDLPSFYASMETSAMRGKSEPRYTSTDVALLIRKMKGEGVGGIILDLRRNGGGSLEEAIRMAGLFIKEGPIVQVRGPEGAPIVDADTDPSVLWDGPLVVLTSRFSASASEIVAAAMQDYGRALVVGDVSTHGKGTVQSLSQLKPYIRMMGYDMTNEPGALKFTIKKFYRASGASTQFEGVTPDIVLPSVMNHSKDVGEKSLENPLPWDTTTPAKFEKVDRVAPYLAELKSASDLRIVRSKDFEYIREDIARYLKHQEDKSISLNEKERLKEKAEEDAREKAREKERLARKTPEPRVYELSLKLAELPGLPDPVQKTNSIAAKTTAGAAVMAASVGDPAGSPGEDPVEDKAPAVDPVLDEAQFILVDYLHLLGKEIAARK